MRIHVFGVAILLAVALALFGCGVPDKAKENEVAIAGAKPETVAEYSNGASFYSVRVVRVRVDGGWLYISVSGKGGLSQTFIPNGK